MGPVYHKFVIIFLTITLNVCIEFSKYVSLRRVFPFNTTYDHMFVFVEK